jgi:glutathione peroxidase
MFLNILLPVITAISSIYSFTLPGVNGSTINLNNYAGKKILLVNTATQSPDAGQFAGLQQLYNKYKDSLVIIAIPSNNFNGMEPGSNTEIQQFLQQYNLTFPVAAKTDVAGEQAHPLFVWLRHKDQNGVMDVYLRWNFTKVLIGKTGMVERVFSPGVPPMSEAIQRAVEGRE